MGKKKPRFWDGPPPIPDPSSIVSDLSCQGIVGVTLLEALLEITNDVSHTHVDHYQCPILKRNTHPSGDPKLTGKRKHEVIEATSCSKQRNSLEHQQNQQSQQTMTKYLDQTAVDRIMQSFGEAVSRTHSIDLEDSFNKIAVKDVALPDMGSETITGGPAVVLRGRLDHFNRYNNKWRFVVHDAELLERNQLDRNNRPRERPPLNECTSQDALGKQLEGQNAGSVWKCPRLEILAYNELE